MTWQKGLGVFPHITHTQTISPLQDCTFFLGEAVCIPNHLCPALHVLDRKQEEGAIQTYPLKGFIQKNVKSHVSTQNRKSNYCRQNGLPMTSICIVRRSQILSIDKAEIMTYWYWEDVKRKSACV